MILPLNELRAEAALLCTSVVATVAAESSLDDALRSALERVPALAIGLAAIIYVIRIFIAHTEHNTDTIAASMERLAKSIEKLEDKL